MPRPAHHIPRTRTLELPPLVKPETRLSIIGFLHKTARILRYFKPYWKQWFVLFVIANFYTALSLVDPLIVRMLIDDVLVKKDWMLLYWLIGLFVGIALLTALLGVVSAWIYARLSLHLLYDVRNQLFQHLERLHAGFYHEHKLGDILTRLTDDVGGIDDFLNLVFNNLILNVLFLTFLLTISFTLSWEMTLAGLAVIPLLVWAQRYYGEKIRQQFKAVREQSAEYISYLQERLGAVHVSQLFTREGYELEAQKRKAKALISKETRLALSSALLASLTGLLIAAALLFILWYGAIQVITGVLTIGTLVAIYTYIGRLFGPIQTLTDLNVAFQTTLVSVDRVFEFLDTEPLVKERPGARELARVRGDIRFNRVSFAYEQEPVLDNVSLRIKPGETVGVVGPSGVGKTSLVRLIARLYDPNKGRVLLDGRDVRELKLDSLRRHIGVVEQEVILFNASVAENIAYGKPGASRAEIEQAAKLANAHEFIVALPQGYNTVLGERGARLSRGQAQRIAIGRMLLKDPKILIFDEATSALDTESELKIQEAIRRISKGRTVIIIAHRLSTLEGIDRILVLAGKRITEQGTFAQLMEKRGDFYALYTAQFGGFHAFLEKLDYEIKRARGEKKRVLVSGVRIMNLEELARQHGHLAVEALLEKMTGFLHAHAREIDFVARDPHQRDLFYVAMPGQAPEEAKQMCRKCFADLAKLPLPLKARAEFVESDVHAKSAEELAKHVKHALAK